YTGSAAEVRDDDATVGDFRRDPRENGGDVFVGQTVKAIALNTGATDFARERDQLRDGGLAAMKTGIEAGYLRHTRHSMRDCVDRGEVIRLVQRRQRR